MTAPLRYGPFQVEARRVTRGPTAKPMIRVDQFIDGEWETITLLDPDHLMWLLPALREAWMLAIECERQARVA
ncbi:MAG: hypothetical protein RLN60_03490 [Phycisphaerales bacterium]